MPAHDSDVSSCPIHIPEQVLTSLDPLGAPAVPLRVARLKVSREQPSRPSAPSDPVRSGTTRPASRRAPGSRSLRAIEPPFDGTSCFGITGWSRPMPLSFFDVYDNDKLVTDDISVELGSLTKVRKQALSLLPDIARD